MGIGKTNKTENTDFRLRVIRHRFTPKNIGNFYIKDRRVGTDRFKEEMEGVKKAILEMKTSPKTKWYPERYDLTVFTYNQNIDPPYLIIDGSHRLKALEELFKEGTLKHFEAILIPSNLIYRDMTPKEMLEMNRKLDKELAKQGIPKWVKKYDYDEEAIRYQDRIFRINSSKNIWVNKNLIDSGGKNNRKLTIEQYEATRQKAP